MSVIVVSRWQDAADVLQGRGGPVVVVPVFNAFDDAIQCLRALARHSPAGTDILLIDDGSTDDRLAGLQSNFPELMHRVLLLTRRENLGFVATVNEGMRAAGRRDVVILNSDVIVGPEWLERLRDAAYSDSRVATATPLTNNGTILSVPTRNTPSELPLGFTPEQAANAVAAASARLRPRIPTCIGHCVYVKRMAIDLVGELDEVFSPGYGEEVDFSQRCILMGLAHVCADDVFVYHRQGASFGQSPEIRQLKDGHELVIAHRYPYYHGWVEQVASATDSDLASAIATARRALLGLTIIVDATCLGPLKELMGTHRVVVETIRALARHPRVEHIVAAVPPVASPYLQAAFADYPKLRIVREGEPLSDVVADVAYRPFQVTAMRDLAWLRERAERIVVAQLDFIAFNNPDYFPNVQSWLAYREQTRMTLAVADGIAFNSGHVAFEAEAEGLVHPGRPTRVVYNGTDHDHFASAATRPALVPDEATSSGFVLSLGADYRHKNRFFTLRVFAELCRRGYRGHLVLAGPRVPNGSSRPDEAAFLLANPGLESRVTTLAGVSEEEKRWLYQHASLIMYPTLYEGFGLMPFEAASAGIPCLSSAQGSLREILPDGIDVIVEWDPAVVADQALSLLGDERRRAAMVERMRERSRAFTWDHVADNLVALFEEVVRSRRSATLAADAGRASADEFSIIRRLWWFRLFSPGWRGWLRRLVGLPGALPLDIVLMRAKRSPLGPLGQRLVAAALHRHYQRQVRIRQETLPRATSVEPGSPNGGSGVAEATPDVSPTHGVRPPGRDAAAPDIASKTEPRQ